mgnify:CR=1 FL=1
MGDGHILDKAAMRAAYDADVERRDAMTPDRWRTDVVDGLLSRIGAGASVLELGCGTGQLAAYASSKGHPVTAIDLSPGNVAAARARGIEAHEADFSSLPFPDAAFEGAFAMQSLIHIRKDDNPVVFREIRRVVAAGATMVSITWGGERHEGPLDDDWLDPPRYFSFYPDDELLELERPGFEVVDLSIVIATEHDDLRAQVLTLEAV